MATSMSPGDARWARARTYPLWGALLAAGAPAGYLALKMAVSGSPGSLEWVAREVAGSVGTYGYLGLSTLLVFAALGRILGRKEDALEQSSATDPLTRLWNRRHLRRRLAEEVARATRLQTPLALLFVDVDRLKALNDRWGHEAGDLALDLVGETLRETCRATDVAARFGGDEFVVLAPDTTAHQAVDLAERLRTVLRSRLPSVTVSVGVADLDRARALELESLLEAADRAAYRAKALGRDRIELAPLDCPRQRDRNSRGASRLLRASAETTGAPRPRAAELALAHMRLPPSVARSARRKRPTARSMR